MTIHTLSQDSAHRSMPFHDRPLDDYPCTPETCQHAKDAAWKERAAILRTLIANGTPSDLEVAERLLAAWVAESRPNVTAFRSKGRPQ